MKEITPHELKRRSDNARPQILASYSAVNIHGRRERKEIVLSAKGLLTFNYYTIGIEHSETEFCGTDYEKANKLYNEIKL